MTDESEGLKPCPFCGGDGLRSNYIVEAAVCCSTCAATITRKHAPGEDTGLPEVLSAWNRRAAVPTPEPDVVSDVVERAERIRAFAQDLLDNGHLNSGAVGNTMAIRDEAAALTKIGDNHD